jgi:CheY-like chemotaxis protein
LEKWQVLVVDDEPDIHAVTELALKHRKWRGRQFAITGAKSAREAREVLTHQPALYDVALVDVVMETDNAGLDLCKFIRETCSRSLRIVLRTGQPGIAPAEQVLNDYDIDTYLAKSEATSDRLMSSIRTALRASQDIRTLLALKAQLEGFALCFQKLATKNDLETIMKASLAHLETKFGAKVAFFSNIDTDVQGSERIRAALASARKREGAFGGLHTGPDLGLRAGEWVLPVQLKVMGQTREGGVLHRLKSLFSDTTSSASLQTVDAGFGITFNSEPSEAERKDFQHDMNLFLYNWRLAYTALCAQEDVAYQRALQEYQRRARIEAPRGSGA